MRAPNLQRVTMDYVITEDRFRLTGETTEGNKICLWLTQRLLLRIIPALLDWLDKAPAIGTRTVSYMPESRQMMHLFAQLSAQERLTGNTPVMATPSQDAPKNMVTSVDVGKSEKLVKLCFRDPAAELARITMDAPQLRQWLLILHRLWRTASWPEQIWPAWVQPDAAVSDEEKRSMH